MSKSKRRQNVVGISKKDQRKELNRAHRRSTKHKLKLGMFDKLYETPKRVGLETPTVRENPDW